VLLQQHAILEIYPPSFDNDMDPREYQLTTKGFNIRFSCNPSRQPDDGNVDGVYAAIDAALEKYKIAKDERAAAHSSTPHPSSTETTCQTA
jgi:hypothetical protein